MQTGRDDRSLGELFAELAQETSTLVRQEVELARVELSQKAAQLGRAIASLVIGGAVAYAGFLAIMATVIVALADAGLDWWLAALIVGLVVVGVGVALLARGRSALQLANLAPSRTVETLKEDQEWAKEQIR
jgi:uncharacterized membrane protein YqjE